MATIREALATMSIWDLEGPLDSALKELSEEYENNKDRGEVRLEFQASHFSEDYTQIHIYLEREETDKEEQERLDAQEKEKVRLEEADRKLLAKLKKKYEPQ